MFTTVNGQLFLNDSLLKLWATIKDIKNYVKCKIHWIINLSFVFKRIKIVTLLNVKINFSFVKLGNYQKIVFETTCYAHCIQHLLSNVNT